LTRIDVADTVPAVKVPVTLASAEVRAVNWAAVEVKVPVVLMSVEDSVVICPLGAVMLLLVSAVKEADVLVSDVKLALVLVSVVKEAVPAWRFLVTSKLRKEAFCDNPVILRLIVPPLVELFPKRDI
jgi:hypothetical protein